MYQLSLSLTYISLIFLAVGAFTSISLLSISFILLLLPSIYFFWTSEKKMSKSQWALLILIVIFALSLFVNFNKDFFWKNFSRIKYFAIPFLGIFAYQEAFKKYIDLKKKKILLHLFLVSTSIGTLSGLLAIKLGYNPLTQKLIPYPGRATGAFTFLMPYAFGISSFMLILAGLIIYRDKIKEYISLGWLLVHFLINFLGLYFSYSRGALLGFLLLLPLYFWGKSKKLFLLVTTFSVVFLGASVSIDNYAKDRFFNSDSSNNQRISLFQTAFYQFLEKPILGQGFNTFEHQVSRIKIAHNLSYGDHVSHAHNNYLQILATTGILGLVFLILFQLSYAIEANRSGTFWGQINFVFIISFVLCGMVDYTLGMSHIMPFFMGVYALFKSNSAATDYLILPQVK